MTPLFALFGLGILEIVTFLVITLAVGVVVFVVVIAARGNRHRRNNSE